MTLRVVFLLFAFLSTGAASIAQPKASGPPLPPQPKVRPVGMPANALMVSPCVQMMGEHWAALKDLPFGPIYGTMEGQIVFTEVMIDKVAFAGKSWGDQLKPLPGYAINHVDIWFEPNGHPGYMIPHYDIHAWYVPHSVHMKFCPNGIRVPGEHP